MATVKGATAGSFLTQKQVIDRLYAQAMKALRGQENESVLRLMKAYRLAQDEIVARLGTHIAGTAGWSLTQFEDSGRMQSLLTSVEEILGKLQAAADTEITNGAMVQFSSSYDRTTWAMDQATPSNLQVRHARPPENAVRILVNTPYKGAMFSQRIGLITNAMASDIRDALTQSIIQGEGIDLAALRVQKIIGIDNLRDPTAYANRARVIARSEIMRAQNLARNFTYEQNKDLLDEEQTEWIVTPDDRLCPWCLRREGLTDEEIEASDDEDDPWGNSTDVPLHPNCVPAGTVVLAPEIQAATKAFYRGRIIKVSLSDGGSFTATKNHPILTPWGWALAGSLCEGGHVIRSTDPKRMMKAINPDHHDSPAPIEQVFSALEVSGGMASRSVETTAKDFHGDAAGFDGKVEIVGPHRLLRSDSETPFFEKIGHALLSLGSDIARLFSGQRSLAEAGPAFAGAPHSFMGGSTKALSFRDASVSHACEHCGRATTDDDAHFFEAQPNDIPRHTSVSRDLIFRLAAFVEPAKIIKVETFDFSGHVYDLQSGFSPIYTCNGIIAHNCRCVKAPKLKTWKDLIGLEMPENLKDDYRGMRNPEGRWEIQPVEKFDAWLERRAGELGVEAP